MQTELKIAFIGGGNMAQALIGGLAGKLTAASNIHVIDVNPDALAVLTKKFGVTTAAAADSKIAAADVIVLAVKPQQMHEVIVTIKPHVKHQLVLSIAAGIRAVDLSRWLGNHGAIVRSMPNTPALIGLGITGLAALPAVTNAQIEMADAIMRAVGETVWLQDETKIDAVTAISGSGPAYVFYFLEAMQEAALGLGLTAEQGKQLALATFAGATQLAKQSDESVEILRERVTSKGGTTFAALAAMEGSGVRHGIVNALHAAAKRGKELGEEFGQQ